MAREKKIDVRKLSRQDLLEMLLEEEKKIESLEKELKQTKEALEEKKIKILEAGNIAEAALKLNRIFEVAQEAADQYLMSVKLMSENKEGVTYGKKEKS